MERGRQVVITGAGLCCHLGDELAAITATLRAGRPVAFAEYAPGREYGARCRWAGLYGGALDDDRQRTRFMGRAGKLAYHAAAAALAESGLERRDLAVIAGSGTGDVETICAVDKKLRETHSARRISPVVVPRMMASTVAANLAAIFGATGPSFTVSAACAGGALNLVVAAELIERGHIDAALAGGAEAADPIFHAGFEAMRACNCNPEDPPERACRPYAADRAGFVFGEGAGMVLLETRAAAERRGAAILGVLRGFGMSSDGSGDMVAPSADGVLEAVGRARAHAGGAPRDIDYVNTHGTSTPLGDLSEVRALRRLFDGRHVAYSSTKGYTGHTVSAAGAIEAILTWTMLREGWIAPSLNAAPLDPGLDDYPPATQPTSRHLRFAMSNSLGFGGTNVSLVLAAS
jgi:3-oxoacyl-[acyl-carrier-protein] synthase-1